MPLADPEGKKQKKSTDKASLRSLLALRPPTGKRQNVQSTENMCPCEQVNKTDFSHMLNFCQENLKNAMLGTFSYFMS